jgi:hypothetical protein
MIAEMRRWRIVMRNDTNLSSSSKDLCAVSMVNYMCMVSFASSSALHFAYKKHTDPRSYSYSNTVNNRFIFPKKKHDKEPTMSVFACSPSKNSEHDASLYHKIDDITIPCCLESEKTLTI